MNFKYTIIKKDFQSNNTLNFNFSGVNRKISRRENKYRYMNVILIINKINL